MILNAIKVYNDTYDLQYLIDNLNENSYSIEEKKKHKQQVLDLTKSIEAVVLPVDLSPDFLLFYSKDKVQEVFEKF